MGLWRETFLYIQFCLGCLAHRERDSFTLPNQLCALHKFDRPLKRPPRNKEQNFVKLWPFRKKEWF